MRSIGQSLKTGFEETAAALTVKRFSLALKSGLRSFY
jgi:hypothetical protein